MVLKHISLLGLIAAASGVVVPLHLAPTTHVYLKPAPIRAELNEEAPAHYEFEYSVNDPVSGDIKQQKETRNGDSVQGIYSFHQPDGFERIVEYSSSKDDGFQAHVRFESQKVKPVAKVAPLKYVVAPGLHTPVSAKLTYATAPEATNIHVIPSKIFYSQTPYVTHASQVHGPSQVSFALDPAQVGYSQGSQVTYAPVIFGRPLTHVIYTQPLSKVSHLGAPQIPYQEPSQVTYSQVPATQRSHQLPQQDPSQINYSRIPFIQVSEQIPYQDSSQVTYPQVPATQGSQQFPYQDTSQSTYSQDPAQVSQVSDHFLYQDPSQVTYSQVPANQGSTQGPSLPTYYSSDDQLGKISNAPRRRAKNSQSRQS